VAARGGWAEDDVEAVADADDLGTFASPRPAALRRRLWAALVVRGLRSADVDGAVEAAVQRLGTDPGRFGGPKSSLDEHAGFLVRLALEASLNQLHDERHRRQDPGAQAATRPQLVAEVDERGEIVERVGAAVLTSRQCRYLRAVLVQGVSVEAVAAEESTTVAEVQDVLRCAVEMLERHWARDPHER